MPTTGRAKLKTMYRKKSRIKICLILFGVPPLTAESSLKYFVNGELSNSLLQSQMARQKAGRMSVECRINKHMNWRRIHWHFSWKECASYTSKKNSQLFALSFVSCYVTNVRQWSAAALEILSAIVTSTIVTKSVCEARSDLSRLDETQLDHDLANSEFMIAPIGNVIRFKYSISRNNSKTDSFCRVHRPANMPLTDFGSRPLTFGNHLFYPALSQWQQCSAQFWCLHCALCARDHVAHQPVSARFQKYSISTHIASESIRNWDETIEWWRNDFAREPSISLRPIITRIQWICRFLETRCNQCVHITKVLISSWRVVCVYIYYFIRIRCMRNWVFFFLFVNLFTNWCLSIFRFRINIDQYAFGAFLSCSHSHL